MGLKRKINKDAFKELGEDLQKLYKEEGDFYHLDVEGDDDLVESTKKQIKEFRDNNTNLIKANRELESKLKEFENLDPKEAREALSQLQKVKDKKLIDEGKIEELFTQRTERMVADYEGKIKALTNEVDSGKQTLSKYKERLNKEVIDAKLSQAVSSVGTIKKGAMGDILRRGRAEWKLDDDSNPIPYDSDGNVLYGSDAKTPMTPEEWAKGLAQDSPYFFEDTRGAGSSGNTNSGKSNVGDTVIDSKDKQSYGKNIENIAKGKVKVHMGR